MHKTDFFSRLRDVVFLRAHQQTLTWGWTKPVQPTLGGLRVRDKLRLFADGQIPGLEAILCEYGHHPQCLGSVRGAHGPCQDPKRAMPKWVILLFLFSHTSSELQSSTLQGSWLPLFLWILLSNSLCFFPHKLHLYQYIFVLPILRMVFPQETDYKKLSLYTPACSKNWQSNFRAQIPSEMLPHTGVAQRLVAHSSYIH